MLLSGRHGLRHGHRHGRAPVRVSYCPAVWCGFWLNFVGFSPEWVSFLLLLNLMCKNTYFIESGELLELHNIRIFRFQSS